MFDNQYADEIQEFRKKIIELFNAFDQFGKELMEAVALYLDLEQGYFEPHINNVNSVLRTIH